MILEEKHSDGTVFIYDDGKYYFRNDSFTHNFSLEGITVDPAHQECYQNLVKRVERKKKLEKLLSHP